MDKEIKGEQGQPSPVIPAASETVISLSNISKKYNLYRKKQDRLKEALDPRRKSYHRDFYALNGINFDVKRGESVGILGMNGAGKSTLLKLITGVIVPTKGQRVINGNISALLELGSGFNPEFSGYENVFFYGAIMGFTKDQMQVKVEEILEFADIGEYIYQPVKTYSSGMKARLAFSVATSIEPDILILDEVLSVGDMFFQAKCTHRMQSMIKNENTTVLFVSHNVQAVKAICDRCILLEGGKVIMDSNTQDVVNEYFKKQVQSRQSVIEKQIVNTVSPKNKNLDYLLNSENFQKKASHGRVQNGKAEFLNVQLLDENENIIEKVEYGQNVILRMVLQINEDSERLGCGYNITDKNGINVINSGSAIEDRYLINVVNYQRYIVDYKFCLEILEGNYSVTAAVSTPPEYSLNNIVEFCDYIPIAVNFTVCVREPVKIYGLVHINNIVEITEWS